MIVAVPAGVNCAVPIIAEFMQYVAVASQIVTVPTVTGDPLDTAAVKVTAVPEVTEEDDSVSVVVVELAARAHSTSKSPSTPSVRTIRSPI